jgi:soluble lytic murein transglycosylase-like protein
MPVNAFHTTGTGAASRRALLQTGATCALAGCSIVARATTAGVSPPWHIYPASETKVLMPVATSAPAAAAERTLPASKEVRRSRTAPVDKRGARPPAAFEQAAARHGIPAWLVYGVALQESQVTIGRTALPYPWTLCVSGRGERYADVHAARRALRGYLDVGVTNVDCGPMQVNWRWHRDKLQSVDRALDPYANLDVGAGILADLRRSTGDWRMAVQLYHAGSLDTLERRTRAARYLASVQRVLARHGQSFAAEGGPHG